MGSRGAGQGSVDHEGQGLSRPSSAATWLRPRLSAVHLAVTEERTTRMIGVSLSCGRAGIVVEPGLIDSVHRAQPHEPWGTPEVRASARVGKKARPPRAGCAPAATGELVGGEPALQKRPCVNAGGGVRPDEPPGRRRAGCDCADEWFKPTSSSAADDASVEIGPPTPTPGRCARCTIDGGVNDPGPVAAFDSSSQGNRAPTRSGWWST